MDPLSAIGLASAVAQFIDVGFKIGKRLAEYNKASPNEVPRSLQSINTQLPLLVNALQRVKSDVELGKFDFDTRCILKGVISGCGGLIQEVESILNKVAKAPGESLASKLRKSFASFKHDEKILAIDKNLQTYINVLILHHVIDSEDIPHWLPEEVDYYEVKEKRAEPFADRKDLIEKLDQLFYDAARAQVDRPTVVVLIGNSGAGKTQLALEYSRQSHALGQFKTVFWLNAQTPHGLLRSLEGIASVVRRSTEGTQDEKIEFVRNFLSERWHPWLLVLDGYDHNAFEDTGLLQNLPDSGYGAILVTTSHKSANNLGSSLEVQRYLTDAEKEELSWALTSAIKNRELEDVKRFVSQGAVINAIDNNGWAHIARAAVYGNTAIYRYLLDSGGDPGFKLAHQNHSLHWAASGYPEIVDLILDYEDAHGEEQAKEDYDQALTAAAEKGCEKTVRLLMERRQASLNSKDSYGNSALSLALKSGNEGLVRFMLEHNAVPTKEEEKGNVLFRAIDTCRLDILKLLIDTAKLDPSLTNKYCDSALHCVMKLNDGNDKQSRVIDLAKYLLEAGADPNAPSSDNHKSYPIQEAALRGFEDRAQLLLSYGAKVELEDRMGFNALTSAAKYNTPNMFPILLSANIPDPAARTKFLSKGLQFGARNGKRELVLAVLRADGTVELDHTDWRGMTPLLLAIEGGHIETARLLIRHKPRQDIPDKFGHLPLHLAAEKGYDMTVRDLLKASKNPGQKDKNEDTALHLAAAKGHAKVVKMLLDAGADTDEMNKFGDIALDLAEEKGHKEIVKLLEEWGFEKT
ncbi:MAG: hypothetical protein LQ340_006841 [Diploschistes diacapsis]|nr:MAG: hypothetical protein LQ340_006841 [Diploschistes diacapsis]